MSLQDLLYGLSAPTEEHVLSAVALDGHPGVYIARGAGSRVALVGVASGQATTPVRLRSITALWGTTIRMEVEDHPETLRADVIQCIDSPDGRADFLLLAQAVLATTAPGDAIRTTFERLVSLLRHRARPRRETVLGLWGELFLLSVADDPSELITSWRVDMTDQLDFGDSASGIEVKTATASERIHGFALDQVDHEPGHVYIASILTGSAGGGASIEDLRQEISQRIDVQSAQRVVHVIRETLGADAVDSEGQKYDTARAANSLRFFDAANVPRPTIPAGEDRVFNVKFRTRLDDGEQSPPPVAITDTADR